MRYHYASIRKAKVRKTDNNSVIDDAEGLVGLKVVQPLCKTVGQYLFLKLINYFWLCWVLVAACGLSLVAASRGYSSLQCVGFSLRWLLLLRSMGSRHAGFNSCGTWAQQLQLAGPCSERGLLLLQCVGFLLRWLLLLQSMGSRHKGFSSCGAQAQ